jgi:chromosome partitioning protein
LANQKGGVGKTTTVVNLAAGLGALGRNVLVVDLDPQANATSGLGVAQQAGTSLYSALVGDATARSLIQPTVAPGVHLIPSELDLAGAEVDVARLERYLHRFHEVLQPVVDEGAYDFVIVDCPPSLGILTMNALAAVHSAVVPIQCEYYALEGLSVINRIIQQLRESNANPLIGIEGVLLTMFDARTNLAAEVVAEVRAHFGEVVYQTVIPRNIRLSEAPSFGKPVMLHDPACAGARAYRQFAEEFLKRADGYRQAVPAH